jgi:hypothetical protein
MKLALSMLCALSCLIVLASQPARAQCRLSDEEYARSPEVKRFSRLLHVSKRKADPSGEQLVVTAAAAGYILGKQAQYLGDSRERNEIFTCMRTAITEQLPRLATDVPDLAAGALTAQEADRVYQEALLGIMDDEELRRLGVDTSLHYPSIFEPVDVWTFTIELAPPLKSKPSQLSMEVIEEPDGVFVTAIKKGQRGSRTRAHVEGRTISFQFQEKGGHRHDFVLTYRGDGACSGSMTSHGPSDRSAAWVLSDCFVY